MPVHFLWPVDISQIDDNGAGHHVAQTVEIERAELFPFGRDNERIGILGTIISVRRSRPRP